MPQDQDNDNGACVVRQAPTPGPLSEPVKGAANGLCNRSACQAPLAGEPTHQFMDGNFTGGPRLHYCEKCAKDFDKWDAIDMKDGEPRRIQREPKSLAPTAPVEASGSEREASDHIAYLEETFRLMLGDKRLKGPIYSRVVTAGWRLKEMKAALRPQPSGETRGAVERLEAMLPAIERIFPVHVTETPDYAELAFHECGAKAMTVEPDTWTALNALATDLRALLSARPLALGGQS